MLRTTVLITVLSALGSAQDAPPAPASNAPETPAAATSVLTGSPAPQASSTPGQTETQPVKPVKTETAPQKLLDDGLLDPSWFGANISFTKGSDIDYFWMKPGLNLNDRVIYMKPWEDPTILKKGRDGKDNAKATELTDSFPGMLRGAITGALSGKAKASRSEGDIVLTGRFVDANAGSKAAKWLIGLGAGSETATWDLKFLDAKTGELLLAIHHRSISGTAMSSINDKLVKWADKFASFLAVNAIKQ